MNRERERERWERRQRKIEIGRGDRPKNLIFHDEDRCYRHKTPSLWLFLKFCCMFEIFLDLF